MTPAEYNQTFQRRTKQFAVAVIRLSAVLPKAIAADVMVKQMIRSVTSMAANYRASGIARSDRERYAKLCIVLEEADETLFWLEMLVEAALIEEAIIQQELAEAKELIRVFMAYRSKLKTHLSNP